MECHTGIYTTLGIFFKGYDLLRYCFPVVYYSTNAVNLYYECNQFSRLGVELKPQNLPVYAVVYQIPYMHH